MGIGVREAIYICLECLVFAILILIVSLFGGYARESLHTKGNLNAQMTEIKEYRDIYEFTMGCELKTYDINSYMKQYGSLPNINLKSEFINYPQRELDIFLGWNIDKYYDKEDTFFSIGTEWAFADTIISGEDVIRFIGKFPNQYNVIIFRKTDTSLIIDKLKKEDPVEKWSMSYNMELLGDSEIKDFYCFSVFDDDRGRYDCIVFIEKAYVDYVIEDSYSYEYSSCTDGNYRDSWDGYLY